MKALKITRTDAGQFVVETSTGVRAVGSTLPSALDKLLIVKPDVLSSSLGERYLALTIIFDRIRDIPTGQIQQGQASA